MRNAKRAQRQIFRKETFISLFYESFFFILLTQRTCIKLKVFGTFGSNAIPVPGTYRMNIRKMFFVFIKKEMNRFLIGESVSCILSRFSTNMIDAHVLYDRKNEYQMRRLPEYIGRHW